MGWWWEPGVYTTHARALSWESHVADPAHTPSFMLSPYPHPFIHMHFQQPFSDLETYRGALTRAQNAAAAWGDGAGRGRRPDFAVGLVSVCFDIGGSLHGMNRLG